MFQIHRKLFCFIAILSLVTAASSPANEPVEQSGPKFIFETGPPPWAGERILLPPDFARDLGWTGVEEIRFAPGMFQPGEPDFFSYILVFVLEEGADVSEEGLQREMLTYYSGLAKAVMGRAGDSVNTDDFSVELSKVKPEESPGPDSAMEAIAWRATLDWVEPFATKERQTLHLEFHTWIHDGQPVVLSCVSPVDPESAEGPWQALRAIRKSFRLE